MGYISKGGFSSTAQFSQVALHSSTAFALLITTVCILSHSTSHAFLSRSLEVLPPSRGSETEDGSKDGKLSYDCVNQQFVNKKSGVLYSPRYPAEYPNFANCLYSIQVPEGNTVELKLYDLATEPCCDKVRIYDGDIVHKKKSTKLLDTWRGQLKPRTVVRSSGANMSLNFTTDLEGTDRGFYARFDAVPSNNDENPSRTACPHDRHFTDKWGVLVSPHWPDNYASMASCPYQIDVEKGKRIRLHVNYFHTEACCDILKVYDRSVGLQAGQEYRNMSGWLAEGHTVVSKSNQLVLRFISDIENEMEGFSITYTTI